MIGISQPHMHNVLKGVRTLSPEISDSILNLLHISLLDLTTPRDMAAHFQLRGALDPVSKLPFLDTPIGPAKPRPPTIDRQRSQTPFPAAAAPPTLVVARLALDPHMDTTLARCDIALLDTSERQRAEASPEGLYAVERAGELVLRYMRPGARGYYLVTDAALESPQQWERVSISRRELPAFIKARVLWLGREKDRDLPMHQRGRFLYDVISS
jgi:hypothetical protein